MFPTRGEMEKKARRLFLPQDIRGRTGRRKILKFIAEKI